MAKKSEKQPVGTTPPENPTIPATTSMTLINIGAAVGLAVLFVVVMQAMGSILKPFFIAIFLSILIYPAVALLVRFKVPRFIAYFVVFGAIVGVIYVLGILVSINVSAFVERLPFYETRLTTITEQALMLIQRMITFDRWGLTKGIDLTAIDPFQYISLPKITSYIGASLGSVFDIVGVVFVILFFMVFILMEADRIPARVTWAYGEANAPEILAVADDINTSVMKYLWVKTLINIATGLLTALVLGIGGIDFFILWGIMAFVLNYIPYVGSIFAVGFPFLMALVQISPLGALVILLCLIVVHFSLGNFIEPKVMGRELNLSPLVVLISLAFWGWLWGFIGMVLAIPITATIKIVMEHIPATRNLARFMSDVLELPAERPPRRRIPIFSLLQRTKRG
ncbi:MAG: AI-2E family transporter [Deltaproteobacteria bacterium]|nr:AI-2E family transporter [Candidatus Zymogenaceae bacterium]